MDQIAAALGHTDRWRIVELLAERPRSVGELAELTGLRQPQATKHLQTLIRAGLVAMIPLGQRRVCAIETARLQALQGRLAELLETARAQGERDIIARYRAAVEAESQAANRDGWADGRTFSFERVLPSSPDVVWQHWTDSSLLASWWAPTPMTVTECALEPKPGGRAVLEYRDHDGQRYRSEGRIRAAREPEHLVFDLAVLGTSGPGAFISHFDLTLAAVADGTRLHLDLRITNTTTQAVPYIAGIETGWEQVLSNLASTIGKEDTNDHT